MAEVLLQKDDDVGFDSLGVLVDEERARNEEGGEKDTEEDEEGERCAAERGGFKGEVRVSGRARAGAVGALTRALSVVT